METVSRWEHCPLGCVGYEGRAGEGGGEGGQDRTGGGAHHREHGLQTEKKLVYTDGIPPLTVCAHRIDLHERPSALSWRVSEVHSRLCPHNGRSVGSLFGLPHRLPALTSPQFVLTSRKCPVACADCATWPHMQRLEKPPALLRWRAAALNYTP